MLHSSSNRRPSATDVASWTDTLSSVKSVLDFHHRHQAYHSTSDANPALSHTASSHTPSLARNPSLRRTESELRRGIDDADAAGQRARGRPGQSTSTVSGVDADTNQTDVEGINTSSRIESNVDSMKFDIELQAALAVVSVNQSSSGSAKASLYDHTMSRRWLDSLSSFSLANSSFGRTLEKRFAMMQHYASQLKSSTNSEESNQSINQTNNRAKSHDLPSDRISRSPVASAWPSLIGIDTESWPDGLMLLARQIQTLPPLQFAAEHVSHTEIQELFARIQSYTEGINDQQIKLTAASVMVDVAISRTSPQHMLQSIINLLSLQSINQLVSQPFDDELVGNSLKQLQQHASEFDISVPFHQSSLSSFTFVSMAPSTSANAYSSRSPPLTFTVSPSHIFVHSAAGLVKVGTGVNGSVPGQIYAHNPYRQHEPMSIAYVHSNSTLYSSSSQFNFPRIQTISPTTLQPTGFVQLGVDPHRGYPSLRGAATLLTDSRYLYVLEIRELVPPESETSKDSSNSESNERESDEYRRAAQHQLQETVTEVERWLKQKRRESGDVGLASRENIQELAEKAQRLREKMRAIQDQSRSGRRDDSNSRSSDSIDLGTFTPSMFFARLSEAKDVLAQARRDHRSVHQQRRRLEHAQRTQGSGSSSSSDKKQWSIHLWQYDPLVAVSSIIDFDEKSDLPITEAVERDMKERRIKAEEISASFAHCYSPSLCIMALKKCSDDMNAACRWLLEHGDEFRQQRRLPLVRCVELTADDTIRALSPELLSKTITYITPSQLIITIPPHLSSLTPGDDSLVRVYDPQTGALKSEYSGRVGRVGQQAAIDVENNLLWTVHSASVNQFEVTMFTNHGPKHRFTKSADDQLSCDDVLASISSSTALQSPLGMAAVLSAHIDRHLRHRAITPPTHPPLLDLSLRLASLQNQYDTLKKENSALKNQVTQAERKEREMKSDDRDDRDRERERSRMDDDFDEADIRELLAVSAQGSQQASLLSFLGGIDDRAHALDFNALLNRLVSSERSVFGSSAGQGQIQAVSSGGGAGSLFQLSRFRRGGGIAGQQSSSREQLATRYTDSNDRLSILRVDIADLESRISVMSQQRRSSVSGQFAPEAGALPYCLELEDDTFSAIYELLNWSIQHMNDESFMVGSVCSSDLFKYFLHVSLSLLEVHFEALLNTCTSDRYPDITHLAPIRDLLLKLALSPPLSTPAAARTRSVRVLIAGLRVLYPTQTKRVLLLSSLVIDMAHQTDDNKKEFLMGVLSWFSGERDVADALLNQISSSSTGTETSSFISTLLRFSIEEFVKQMQSNNIEQQVLSSPDRSTTSSNRSNAVAAHIMGPSMAQVVANPYLIRPSQEPVKKISTVAPMLPSLKLLLVLLMDLVVKSGLLNETDSSSVSTSNLYLQHLCDFAQVVLDQCTTLAQLLTEKYRHQSVIRSAKGSAALVQYLKQSPFQLLQPLLAALTSPLFIGNDCYISDHLKLVPSVRSLLCAVDKFNSLFPHHVHEDNSFTLQLAGENTRSILIETPHPYSSGPRVLKQTVSIPGATSISWSFDPRSATSNGSDAARFYFDRSMKQGQPVGPFFGNEKDNTSTFPRQTILTPGDTATICFSAKSPPKRESDRNHGSRGSWSEQQRWGFRVIVRGVSIREMNWISDIENNVAAFGSRLCCSLIKGALDNSIEHSNRAFTRLPLFSHGLAASESDATAFLHAFINGSQLASKLTAEFDRHNVVFPGRQVVRRLPDDVKTGWEKALRSVAAAMIKHSGLTNDCVKFFDGSQVATPKLLIDRLKSIFLSAKGLQTWMLEQAQMHGEYERWFEPEHMSTITLNVSVAPSVAEELAEKHELPQHRTNTASQQICYDFTFTASDLRSEYAAQPTKLKQLAVIKRIMLKRVADHRTHGSSSQNSLDPFTIAAPTSSPPQTPMFSPGNTGHLTPLSTPVPSASPQNGAAIQASSSSSVQFDIDHAIDELFKVMEVDRLAKQAQARAEPTDAFHLLDMKERKNRIYRGIVQQIRQLSESVLLFNSRESFSSELPSTSRQGATRSASSSIEDFSLDDSPPLDTLTFQRADSEQSATTHNLPETSPHLQQSQSTRDASSLLLADSDNPRLHDLREWISEYQRFRTWQTNHHSDHIAFSSPLKVSVSPASPVDAIKFLIRENADPSALLLIARNQQQRATLRQQGLHYIQSLLSVVTFEAARVELIGLLPTFLDPGVVSNEPCYALNYVDDDIETGVLSSIECSTLDVKESVRREYEQYVQRLLQLLNQPLPTSTNLSTSSMTHSQTIKSPLNTQVIPIPPVRLNYSSRLLALTDIYSLPLSPVALPGSFSPLVTARGPQLFSVLTNALITTRFIASLRDALQLDSDRKDSRLQDVVKKHEEREAKIEAEQASSDALPARNFFSVLRHHSSEASFAGISQLFSDIESQTLPSDDSAVITDHSEHDTSQTDDDLASEALARRLQEEEESVSGDSDSPGNYSDDPALSDNIRDFLTMHNPSRSRPDRNQASLALGSDEQSDRRAWQLNTSIMRSLMADRDDDDISSTDCDIPTIEYVESILSSQQWAALRVLLVQLIDCDSALIRQHYWRDQENKKDEFVVRRQRLLDAVVRVIIHEFQRAVTMSCAMWRRGAGWAVRRLLLDTVEKVLVLFVTLVSYADMNELISSSNLDPLIAACLLIFRRRMAFTPRILQLCTRFARVLFTRLPVSAFQSKLSLLMSGHNQVTTSLPGYFISMIGDLLIHDTDQDAHRQRLQNIRQRRIDAVKHMKPVDTKTTSMSTASSIAPIKSTSGVISSHAVVAHYDEANDSEKWSNVLAQPDLLDVLYGVRNAVAPAAEAVAAHRIEAYEKRKLGRKGGNKVVCVAKTGIMDISPDQRVTCRAGFSTCVANVTVTSGRWYYQVHLNTRGLMQIGWCNTSHNPNSSTGDGCGDDQHSWSYDGMRLKKWHAGAHSYSTARWNVGDVIGCCLDLDAENGGEMRFYLNGEDLGVAFRGLNVQTGLSPCASLSHGEGCTFVFDPARMKRVGSMKNKIPDGFYPLENDRADSQDPANIRRATEILRGLEYDGIYSVIDGDYAYCCTQAQRLADNGITAIVVPLDSMDALFLNESIDANQDRLAADEDLDAQQIWNGKSTLGLTSEYISLVRYWLTHDKKSGRSAEWSQAVRKILVDSIALTASRSLLLGSIAVLGGFTEHVREGGFAVINGDANMFGRAVIARYLSSEDSNVAHVMLLNELLTDPHAQQLQAHRVKISDIEPCSEFIVDLAAFPFTQQLFDAFQTIIDSSQSSVDTVTRQHCIQALSSMLVNSTDLADLTRTPSLLTGLTSLLLQYAQAGAQGATLEQTVSRCVRLQSRLWELENGIDEQNNVVPFRPLTQKSTSSSSAETSPFQPGKMNEFVYGHSSYTDSSMDNEQFHDDSMLRYWDKHIIPFIQNYVRASFRPYEMENFFAQLRQPLLRNNNAEAVEIALTLCGGNVPDGVVLPDDNKDFSTLSMGDVEVGQNYQVTESARSSDVWVSAMNRLIGHVGRAVVKHTGEELVLLQFVNHRDAIVEQWWFTVESLSKPKQGARTSLIEATRNKELIESQLAAVEPGLTSLLARRALFSLCSHSFTSAQSFLSYQLADKGLDSVFEFVFLAVGESLQLSSLESLGTCASSQHQQSLLLQSNLASFLSSPTLNKGQVRDTVVHHCSKLLKQAAEFTKSKSSTVPFAISHQAASSQKHHISVPDSCLMVLMFAKDCRLSMGCTFSVFTDEELNQRVKLIAGKDEATVPLVPVRISGSSCYLHITKPNDVPAKGAIVVLPVHQSLGVAMWFMNWCLDESMSWLNSSVHACAELASTFASLVVSHFDLVNMPASPLKEAVLTMCAILLYTARSLLDVSSTRKSSSSGHVMAQLLTSLQPLQAELNELFERREKGAEVYSSYLQSLLSLLVVADELRSSNASLVTNWQFRLPATEAEEAKAKEEEERRAAAAASAEWSCEVCTFANPNTDTSCQMCGSGRPKSTASKKVTEKTANAATGASMFHSMRAVGAALRFLIHRDPAASIDDDDAMKALIDYASEEIRRDRVEDRLVVIENVPTGAPDKVKNALVAVIQSIMPSISVVINLYTDPSLPSIPVSLKRTASGSGSPTPRRERASFEPKRCFDENGVLYYLGFQSGTESSWKNPHELGIVVCSASSIDGSSISLKNIVSRTTGHFATRPTSRSYIQLEFTQHQLIPTHYTLRNTDAGDARGLALKSWKLEASKDAGKTWFLLDERIQDSSIQNKSQAVTFTCNQQLPSGALSSSSYASLFRLTQTGPNHGGSQALALGGLEFYGQLRRKTSKNDAVNTPFVAVVELVSNDRATKDKLIAAIQSFEMPLQLAEQKQDDDANLSTSVSADDDDSDDSGTELAPLFDIVDNDDYDWSSPRRGGSSRASRLQSKVERAAEKMRRREAAQKAKQDREAKDKETELASRFVHLKAKPFTQLTHNDALWTIVMLSKLINDPHAVSSLHPSASLSLATSSTLKNVLTPSFVNAINTIVQQFVDESGLPGQSPRLSWKGVSAVMSFGTLYQAPSTSPLLSAMKQLLSKAESDNGVDISAVTDMFSSVMSPTALSRLSLSTLGSVVSSVCTWLNAAGMDYRLEPHSFVNAQMAYDSQSNDRWTVSADEQLIEFCQMACDRVGEESLLALQPSQLVFVSDDPIQVAMLSKISSVSLNQPALRLRFTVLRKLNSLLSSLLPLVDLRADASNSIAGLIRSCKSILFGSVKSSFVSVIMDSTSIDSKPPRIAVNRVALAQRKQRGDPIDFVRHTNFGNGFRQLFDVPGSSLRPVRPHGTEPFLAFQVEFQQEQVVGEGGPYRQYFSDVAAELVDQSPQSASPLFINSPNKQTQSGEQRDKFVIPPGSVSSIHLQMYEFVGVLMGCCLRTGVRLPIDLPSFVWKPLVGDTLDRGDLAAIDASCAEYLSLIETYDPVLLEQEICATFTTALSDAQTIELCPNGSSTKVTAANRYSYIQLVLAARTTESAIQIEAIRRGLARILPLQLLYTLTWQELAVSVAGKPVIDVALLRKHTEYSSCSSSSPQCQWLWQWLESCDNFHRRLFIRFAWAQDRLPANDDEFARSHVRLLIKASTAPSNQQDRLLPRADTCFFNLELPAYSSRSILEAKMMYAITTCSSMNADERPDDNQQARQHRERIQRRQDPDDY